MREALHAAGARLLEKILAVDAGYRGPHVDCGGGHQASFVSYRTKIFDTALGSIRLCRAWYHCGQCGHGLAPRDDELGLTGGSASRRWWTGSQPKVLSPPASQLLGHLAGVSVGAKRIERASEADGQVLAHVLAAEVTALAAGDATVVGPTLKAPEKLYVALVDGTGVPTVAAEVQGRAAKDADGTARTREAKLAVVFTQTKLDDDGYPVRDPGSSSYLATFEFEAAESFGRYAELAARRRGSDHAAKVVILGDGAEWIWNLAERHFPAATHIVDLYHARQHLHALNQPVGGCQQAVTRCVAR